MNSKYAGISGILILVLILLALAAPKLINDRKEKMGHQKEQAAPKQFVCSMHPQVIRDQPGDCPICGMFLIEKIGQDANSFDSTLASAVMPVNKSVLASVKTIRAERKELPVTIEAAGIINYDPRKIITISARFGGLVEKSFVKYQFQHIEKGRKIYEIYSPDIYTERWNYVKLVQAYPDRDDLTREALEWLDVLGLSRGQIDSLKRTVVPNYHLAVYSQADGYAVSRDFDPETFFFSTNGEAGNPESYLAGTGSIGLTDGITVESGEPLFKLIDVRSLRVDLKVKTEDGALLRTGQKVTVRDAANPGRIISSFVNQIEPLNGGLFQTVKVYFTDNDRILLPGRQIRALIETGSRMSVWIPVTAVVDMGQRTSVFVRSGDRFVATKVRTGVRSDDMIEIVGGLEGDPEIAERALLLTDSDSFVGVN